MSPTSEVPHAALLWDLDNVVVQSQLMPVLVEALKALVQPGDPLIVAAARRTYRASMSSLVNGGFDVVSGGRRPSGADKALLQRARRLMRRGVDHFVVASNDGRFELLARHASVRVATTRPHELSRRLRAAAYAVDDLSWILTTSVSPGECGLGN